MTCDIEKVIDLLPALKDKCAVRIIGGLSNVKEQSRVQQEQQGFVNEIVGFFTGETRRRQDYINRQLTDVVEDTIDQLVTVMNVTELNSRVLGMVVDEIKNLQLHTETIAYDVIAIKNKINDFESRVREQFLSLTEKVNEIDWRYKASHEMDRVFHRWQSGSLDSLPIGIQGYGVLEQLWWGDFGGYIHRYPGEEANKLIKYLKERVIARFAKNAQIQPKTRVAREEWLSEPSVSPVPLQGISQGIELLSDWATEDNAPFVTFARNKLVVGQQLLSVPYLISAERLGRELVDEIFVDRDAA